MDFARKLESIADIYQPDDALMEKTIVNLQREPARQRKFKPAIAATMVAAITLMCAFAYAEGWFKTFSKPLTEKFGDAPAQVELIQQMGQEIGISDTSGGVTVTAEAALSDGYIQAVLYSVKRDNGEAIIPEGETEFEIMFGSQWWSDEDHVDWALDPEARVGNFLDYTPGETVAYAIEYFRIDKTEKSSFYIGMLDMAWYGNGQRNYIGDPYEGWEFEIPVISTNVQSTVLAAGETFSANGENFRIVGIHISPMDLVVDYTVISDTPSNRAIVSGDTVWFREDPFIEDFGLELRLKDGTVIDLTEYDDGNLIKPTGYVETDEKQDVFIVHHGGVLPEIIPLEDMDCVIFNGKEYVVQ